MCFCFPELRLEEQSGPARKADTEHQAKAFLDTPPSLLVLHKEAGIGMVVELETAEVCQVDKHCDISHVRQ